MSIIRVDFYLLSENMHNQKFLTACRLLEKAYLHGHKVFVNCNDKAEAEKLDELLWTFKEDAFIPHNLQDEGLEPPPPIQIGFSKEPRGYTDILLNLGTTIPTYFQKFRRVMEIIESDEESKQSGRVRFLEYRKHSCTIKTHTVMAKASV